MHHVHVGSLFCYGRIINRGKIETKMEREGRSDLILNEVYVRNQLIRCWSALNDLLLRLVLIGQNHCYNMELIYYVMIILLMSLLK